MEVRINQLQKLLYKYISKKKPFMMKGAPGIGKSDSMRQACQKVAKDKKKDFSEVLDPKKFCLIDVRISQLDPSDLRGIPFPDGSKTKWLIPSWLPDDGEGVLFFDEINLAPPSIQAACYQLILDRRLGDYVLPEGWTIVAAGNRSIDKANVFPMAAPLKNRFSHATLMVPSEQEWREWAMGAGIKPDIIAFMAFKPSSLFKFDKKSNDDAFPTPRTWALASHMTEDIKGVSDEELEEDLMIVSSCVGEGTALEYNGFIKLKKKINVEDIIKNPHKVQEIKDVGLKYTLISGLAEKYKADRKRLDEILPVIDYMDPEFGVFLMRLLRGMFPTQFPNDLMKCKNWEKLFKRFNKYIF
jgi:hypothetical protein